MNGSESFEIEGREKAPPVWRGLVRPIGGNGLWEEHRHIHMNAVPRAIARKEASSSNKEGKPYTQV
jgi:hypothetical protein